MKLLRTQIHIIDRNHRLFKYCDDLCYKSKNLYNFINYIMRQEFINNKKLLFAFDLNKQYKHHELFKALPSKTSQMTIMRLGSDWKSYFRAIKDWSKNKSKYCGMPKLPKYKNKNGRFVTFFDKQQLKIIDNKCYFQEKGSLKRNKFIETKLSFVQLFHRTPVQTIKL